MQLEAESIAKLMEQLSITMQPTPQSEEIKCKYCGKTFRKLSTLSAHLCEKKRRAEQEKEVGVQLGFKAYLKFFEATQGSAKNKTYAVFAESQYYSAFVKFGQHLVTIRAINVSSYIDWLLKNRKRLDHWTTDAFYEEWLYEYLRREHPNDALDRTFAEMQRWADETSNQFYDLFRTGSANKVCSMIVHGRISPWVVFNSTSGVEFLSSLNDEQISIIYKYIDPPFWEQKFRDFVADVEFIKMVTSETSL